MRAELLPRREQLSIHTTRAQSGGLPVHAFYSYSCTRLSIAGGGRRGTAAGAEDAESASAVCE